MGVRGRRSGDGDHGGRFQEIDDLVAAEFRKDRAGLLPVAPALAPDERIGAHAAFAQPCPHQIAGGRAELSARRRPNVPDHFRGLGDRVGRFRSGGLRGSGRSGGHAGNGVAAGHGGPAPASPARPPRPELVAQDQAMVRATAVAAVADRRLTPAAGARDEGAAAHAAAGRKASAERLPDRCRMEFPRACSGRASCRRWDRPEGWAVRPAEYRARNRRPGPILNHLVPGFASSHARRPGGRPTSSSAGCFA